MAERIVFVMDLDDELNAPSLNRTTRKQSSKIDTIKAALQNFAYAKSWMRPATVGAPHEFALLGLTNTICWQVPFSSNAAAFAETVESVQACGHFASHCDLDGAFSFAQAELQQSKTSTLRLVLLYGRSQCPPRLVSPARFSWLFQHPGFFFDAMYLHPQQTADNNVQGVFDAITDLEKLLQRPVPDAGSTVAGAAAPVRSQACYMLEGTALSKVHKMFATLLCHPLQRPHEPQQPHSLSGESSRRPSSPAPTVSAATVVAAPAPAHGPGYDYLPSPPAPAATAPPVVHVVPDVSSGTGAGLPNADSDYQNLVDAHLSTVGGASQSRQQPPGGDLFATNSGTSHW